MSDYVEEIRKQMLDLWGKTVAQLEDISKSLMSTSGLEKIKLDQAKLVAERDKLVRRIGEEVVKLLAAGKLKLPKPVMKVYEQLEKVADRLTKKEKAGKAEAAKAKKEVKKTKATVAKTAKKTKKVLKKKPAKKPARKKVARKSTKKVVRKPAKKKVVKKSK